MIKKIIVLSFYFLCITINTFSQAVGVTVFPPTGHFNPTIAGGCNLGLPVITATFISGVGSSLQGNNIVITDPCGTTKVRITLSNVRWSQNPNVNWIHGISFFPASVTLTNTTLPGSWFPFNSSTGQGACHPGITTGVGFYRDGIGAACCAPIAGDGDPGNNYGDQLAACGTNYAFGFDLEFCNSSVLNATDGFVTQVRGTSDYQTGCWDGVDAFGSSTFTYTLNATPPTQPVFTVNPTATAPVRTCSGTTVNYTSTLTSTCGSGSNVTWWTASTGGTLVGTGSPFVYDPAGSACPAGTTLYAACCPIGSTCVSRKAVTISGTCPAALAITAVNKTDPTCATPTGSITGVTVTGNSGAISYMLNPGNITNNTGIFTGLLTGINYTVTVTDATGCSAISNTITFVPAGTGGVPPIVTTNSYTYCQNQPVGVLPLSATTTDVSGILTWYLPGSTTGLPTAPIPSTATAGGPFVYNVTQTIGTCVSALVPINVTINPTPPAPVPTATTLNYCKDSIAVALQAAGTNLLWYVPLGAGTIVTGIAPTPSTANVGTFVYQVSSTLGTGIAPNACEGPKATITVNVFAAPAAPTAASPITYCLNATNATALTATATPGNTLLWYTSATGGTGSTTAPIPSTAVATTTSYYVSQVSSTANGSCASPRTKIDVTVNALPAPPTVTTPISYCQNSTPAALTAGGTGLLWYSVATGGPAGSAIAPTVFTATPGSTTYYVSQTVGCVSPRAAIVVNVIATPSAPSVPATSLTYCQGDVALPLTATAAASNTLVWYTVPTGGTPSNTAPTVSTAVVGVTTYYVSQSTPASIIPPLVPGCEGPRAAITVTVNAKPAPPAVSLTPVSYCQNNVATALTATPTTGGTLLWYTVPTGGTSGNATAPIPSTATVGNSNYYVSQTISGCESNRANIIVNISPALTVNAGPEVTIAGGASIQLNATATAGAGYTWTSNIPPIALSSTNILNPIANPAQTTIYRLTVRDLSGTCLPVFGEVKVNVVQSCINVRNAFTPNGDGINDLWLTYDQNFCLLNGSGVKASVFNRYGSKVYETKDYKNTWDGTYEGKPLPDGTYYAVLEFTLFDGSKQYKRTDVTILR